MRIAIASDHAAIDLKASLREWLIELGHEVADLGPDSGDSVDYPDYGYLLASVVADGTAERGIALCGSGIGISIAVNRNPDMHHSYTDAYVSIRDAFKSAQRQLEAQVKKAQGKVKLHEESGSTGKISSLYVDNDCGWITSSDGYEIYFHRNSLLGDDFDTLRVGLAVQYIEHEDSEEPRASSVRVIGK